MGTISMTVVSHIVKEYQFSLILLFSVDLQNKMLIKLNFYLHFVLVGSLATIYVILYLKLWFSLNPPKTDVHEYYWNTNNYNINQCIAFQNIHVIVCYDQKKVSSTNCVTLLNNNFLYQFLLLSKLNFTKWKFTISLPWSLTRQAPLRRFDIKW